MKKLGFLLMFLFAQNAAFNQVNISVEIDQVGTNIGDCDGFLLGDSDPIWLGDAQDVPNVDGNGFSTFYPGNYETSTNGLAFGPIAPFNIYNVDYGCDNVCFPTDIEIQWKGCENDGLGGSVGYICDGGTGDLLSTINIPTPAAFPAINNYTINQILAGTASGTSCDGDYQINVKITVSGSFLLPAPDAYCDAQALAVGGGVSKFAWCNNTTFEPFEPFGLAPASAPIDMSNGTVWFKFVAPASGSVYINTNLGATNIGTRFIVYHAANGGGCPSLFCLAPMQYLSYTDWSNVGGALGTGSQADLVMDCSNLLAGSGGLIPGDTYYIQLSADDAGVCGAIEIEISDEGGTGRPLFDVPCGATPMPISTTVTSDANGDVPSLSLSKSCTYDDEIDSDYPHATPYDEALVVNNADASVWASFVAPNSGSVSIEANCNLSGEYFTLYYPNPCIAPAVPGQYNCVDLVFDAANGADGGIGATALKTFNCLEPGFTYYIMVDPDNVNVCGALDLWVYDPLLPVPLNDNLCLTAANAAFEIPVASIGATAINITGDNTNACREDLAGEPLLGAAAATVWFSFVAPASGSISLSMAPGSIANVSYAVYASNPENLDGTGCYGGLDGALGTTFTSTQSSNITISPLFEAATNSEQADDICCLVPGATYFIQVDGTTASSIGDFTMSITELEVQSGSITRVNATNFICFGDYIQFTTIGEVMPACMNHGAIVHNQGISPTTAGLQAGVVYEVSVAGVNLYDAINDGSTSIPSNTEVYASAIVDGNAGSGYNFGDLCPSMKASAALPFVFLQPITFATPTFNICDVSIDVNGGLPEYDATYKYTYVVTGPAPSTAIVASSTNHSNASPIEFEATGPGVYNITVSDSVLKSGARCDYSTTINVGATCTSCSSLNPGNISTTANPILCPGSIIVLTLDGTQSFPPGGIFGYFITDATSTKVIKKLFTTGIINNGSIPPGNYCIHTYVTDGSPLPFPADSLFASITGTCFNLNPNCFAITLLSGLDAEITTNCPGGTINGAEFNILNMTGGLKDPSLSFDYQATLTGIDVYGNTYSDPSVPISAGNNLAVWNTMEDGLYTITLTDANSCFIDFDFVSSNCQLVALDNMHISLTGQGFGAYNKLQWLNNKNENCLNYVVQYADDGIAYKTIETLKATHVAGVESYSYNHQTSADGYYKIEGKTKDNNWISSNIIHIKNNDKPTESLVAQPNPFNDIIQIIHPNENGVMQVIDVHGRVVMATKINTLLQNNQVEINASEWANGVYFVRFDGDNTKLTLKIIKQ
jgi:hypothetical protein